MPDLKPCPSCLCHVEQDTAECPFCEAPIADTTIHRVAVAFGLAATLVGCGPVLDDGTSTTDGTSTFDPVTSGTGTSTTSTSSTTGTTTSADTTGAPPTSETSSSSDATGTDSASFIDNPDGGSVYGSSCSVWYRDCADGDKCMPWANDGMGVWNDTRCSPIARAPAAVGEPCTVEDSPTSGLDDCEAGSMCFQVDPTTNEGVCVAFCTGTEAQPTCADPSRVCSITHEGVLVLCLTPCDPLAPQCPEGESCQAGDDAFVCVRAGEGALGDPCGQFVDCELGASCIPDATPGCEEACCTSACDPENPACALPEQTCAAFGTAGVCSVAE